MSMGTSLRTYVNGPFGPISVRDHVAGTTRYYHYDHQGTVQALTNEQGQVRDRYAFDALGNLVKHTGTSINRHWYIGRSGYYRQPDEALDYVRARYYAPAQARWLSLDPLRTPLPYQYVSNRPTRATDPSGLWERKAVHENCTKQWAWETTVWDPDCCGPAYYKSFHIPGAPPGLPAVIMGEAAGAVDEWYNSAAFPPNWPIHFNYDRARGDWERMLKGIPFNLSPDTREQTFYAARNQAVAFAVYATGPRDCETSFRLSGRDFTA